MSLNPQFAATPRYAGVTISTANTGRAGGGTILPVFVAGNQGSRVDWVRSVATVPVVSGVVRYYVSGAQNIYLLQENVITATTPNALTGTWTSDFYPTVAMVIPSGFSLCASTNNADEFDVFAFGGDF